MVTAIAEIVTWHGLDGVAFQIVECRDAPTCEGIAFAVSRDRIYRTKQRIGERVRVRFVPDDQFAHEIEESTHA